MNQEVFKRQNPANRTYARLGCKQWGIIIICVLLSPIFVFLLDLSLRRIVSPWAERFEISLHQDLVDRSFITNQPCKAPCWYNLHLGVSSESEVKDTISQLTFVDQNRIQERDTTWQEEKDAKQIDYSCSYLAGRTCGGIILSQNRLMQVWTQIDYPLTFEEAVGQLGPPSYYAMFPGIEFQNCVISLYWLKNNLEFTASNYQHFSCPFGTGISPAIKVNTLTYSVENNSWLFEKYGDIYHRWQGFSIP